MADWGNVEKIVVLSLIGGGQEAVGRHGWVGGCWPVCNRWSEGPSSNTLWCACLRCMGCIAPYHSHVMKHWHQQGICLHDDAEQMKKKTPNMGQHCMCLLEPGVSSCDPIKHQMPPVSPRSGQYKMIHLHGDQCRHRKGWCLIW